MTFIVNSHPPAQSTLLVVSEPLAVVGAVVGPVDGAAVVGPAVDADAAVEPTEVPTKITCQSMHLLIKVREDVFFCSKCAATCFANTF